VSEHLGKAGDPFTPRTTPSWFVASKKGDITLRLGREQVNTPPSLLTLAGLHHLRPFGPVKGAPYGASLRDRYATLDTPAPAKNRPGPRVSSTLEHAQHQEKSRLDYPAETGKATCAWW
jgi:hypothetical protein